MLIKTPAACLFFTLYMLWFYYRKPHLPIKSTRIFQLITGASFLNVLFDLITLYTVNHRDSVSDTLNLLAHIIYLMSILGYIFLLFLYMRSYLETELRFSRRIKLLHNLPFALSSLGILTLPITYVHGKTTDYSLGPKAYALYGSVVIYLILILYYCFRYWNILNRDKRMAIIMAVPIFVTVSVIQMLMPETLLVVTASTSILLGLILSIENTEKYTDDKTMLFNQYSLETVLEELDFRKQSKHIAVLCFYKTENHTDWKQDILILQDIHKELKNSRLNAYRVCENGVVFISNSMEKASKVLEDVRTAVEMKYGRENLSTATKLLSGEEAGGKYICMQNIIAFCTEVGTRFAYVDQLTHIYNRNAFERDLEKLTEDSEGYYIIADLNNLKVVNDTIGHSAGDELLQSFAALLEDVVRREGRAYRQGGDEFAILYRQDARKLINELKEKCKIYNQSRNVPLSYAIGFCRLSDKDFINVADRMMYEDKKRIKQSASG